MPATVGGQVRCMTPLGSVIPRVTPTATGHDPDHPEPWAVSQSFHQALVQPTRPHSTECLPNLSCLDLLERSERKIGSYLLNSGRADDETRAAAFHPPFDRTAAEPRPHSNVAGVIGCLLRWRGQGRRARWLSPEPGRASPLG